MGGGLTAARLLLNRQVFGALLAAAFAAFRVWPVAILLAVLVVVSALCALVDAVREPSRVKAAEVVAIGLVLAPMLFRRTLRDQVSDPAQTMRALFLGMFAVWLVVWPHSWLRRFGTRLGKALGVR